jgi:hypothetical protein
MPATGELIRMMNYVDDIAATLRRIVVGISTMTPEERKRWPTTCALQIQAL